MRLVVTGVLSSGTDSRWAEQMHQDNSRMKLLGCMVQAGCSSARLWNAAAESGVVLIRVGPGSSDPDGSYCCGSVIPPELMALLPRWIVVKGDVNLVRQSYRAIPVALS